MRTNSLLGSVSLTFAAKWTIDLKDFLLNSKYTCCSTHMRSTHMPAYLVNLIGKKLHGEYLIQVKLSHVFKSLPTCGGEGGGIDQLLERGGMYCI
jgi:hypothetical protein